MANIPVFNNKDMRNSVTLINLKDPVNNLEASNKQYVDNSISQLILNRDTKDPVRVVTTTNITLASAGPNTYDGVTLALNDRIGVVGQTNQAQNGIYTVTTLGTGANGVWTRSTDADISAEVTQGLSFNVIEGTSGAGSVYLLTTPNPIVLNTTNLTFIKTNVGTVKGYSTTLTSGSSSYTVTHNLNTNNTIKAVRNATTSEDVEGVKFTLIGLNSFTADFGESTVDDFIISVTGI